MQNLICFSDMIKLWAAKIKTGCHFQVEFFTVHWSGLTRYIPITSF